MILFAPDIDFITGNLNSFQPVPGQKIFNSLKRVYRTMSILKPLEDSDEVKSLWLSVPRGNIKKFGSYKDFKKEGIVETHSQFNSLWKEQYPDFSKWYRFSTAKYKDELYFYIDGNLIFSLSDKFRNANQINLKEKEINGFVSCLEEKVSSEVGKIEKDTVAYHHNLQKNLSFHKRFGRIKRNDLWKIDKENTHRLDRKINSEEIRILREIVQTQSTDKKNLLFKMTANSYFRICEICYEANNYFKDADRKLSPREKYLRMADGRDAGLRDIDGDSNEDFQKWYHGGIMGSHPWEICRGGNSTHISLFVTKNQGKWELHLDGSSVVRVVETVKAAVALHKNGIPFALVRGREIFDMVTGNDFIGIVPDYITPRYCHHHFPETDRIIDFMHLGNEKSNEIIKKAFWYPLPKAEILKRKTSIEL